MNNALLRSLSLALLLASAGLLSGCFSIQIRELKTEKQMLEARIMQLQQDMAAIEEELFERRRRDEGNSLALKQSENQVKSLSESLRNTQDKLNAAQLALAQSTNSQTKEFAQRLEGALRHETTLRADLEAERDRTASLEVRIQTLEQDIAGHAAERDRLKAQIAESTGRITELTDALTRSRDEAAALNEQASSLTKSAETRGSEARMYADNLEAARAEVKESARRVAELEAQLASAGAAAGRSAVSASTTAEMNTLGAAIATVIPKGAGVRAEGNEVRVMLPSDELFDSGTTLVSDVGLRTLTQVAEKLNGGTWKRLVVEGHTDNVPVRNMPYPDNWELGAARATEVTRFLAARTKLGDRRIVAQSHSSTAPIADSTTADGRRKNRRVEIVIEF